jgi:(S)-mandelate dehydrogenase
LVKALALGANAVAIGRATLYGLTAGGEPGVERALEILTTETRRVLGQLGCCSVADLGPHLLRMPAR